MVFDPHIRDQYDEVYVPQPSTDDQKKELGFKYFDRKKIRLWARTIGLNEAQTYVEVFGDRLLAELGYYMVFNPTMRRTDELIVPGEMVKGFRDLKHYPVRPDAFAQTYRPLAVEWPYDERDFTRIELEFVEQGGYFPCFKFAGVWAKIVTRPTAIIGYEHEGQPKEVPLGMVLALGVDGEPYFMTEGNFRNLYLTKKSKPGTLRPE